MPVLRVIHQEIANAYSGSGSVVFMHGDSRFPAEAVSASLDKVLNTLFDARFKLEGMSAVSHGGSIRTEYVFFRIAALSPNHIDTFNNR